MYYIFYILIPILLLSTLVRYSGNIRYAYFWTWALLQNKKITFITNDKQAKNILKSNIKGTFFEHHVSRHAWKPLVSLESSDGKDWQELHIRFLRYFKPKYFNSRIPDLVHQFWNPPYTSKSISISIAHIFHQLLFDKDLEYPELFYKASIEWRKEIAMKGFANSQIKKEFYQHMQTLVGSANVYDVSAIAQPFFISPMINLSDIMVGIAKVYDPTKTSHTLIRDSLAEYPPFPILERSIGNHHYVCQLDAYKTKLGFGYGSRRCPGESLIMNIMIEMLDHTDWTQFDPEEGHLYSGRTKDSVNTYFIYILVRTLYNTLFNK